MHCVLCHIRDQLRFMMAKLREVMHLSARHILMPSSALTPIHSDMITTQCDPNIKSLHGRREAYHLLESCPVPR